MPGVGEFAHHKNCPRVLPGGGGGGWSGLELTDTLEGIDICGLLLWPPRDVPTTFVHEDVRAIFLGLKYSL